MKIFYEKDADRQSLAKKRSPSWVLAAKVMLTP